MDLWGDPRQRRWLGWATLAAVFLLVSFHRVSTTVLSADLMRAFQPTGTELGLLHASFFYIYAAMQLPSGLLADHVGARRVATAGAVVMSAGVAGFALSDSLLVGFLSRALIGFGGSVIYVTTLRFAANWFRPGEFATMTGLTVSSAGLGGVLAATPLAVLVGAYGWRPSLLGIAALGIVLAVAVYAVVRDRPEDAGLPAIDGVARPSPTSGADVVANAKRVLGERSTWLLGLLLFFTFGASFTVLGLWAVPFLVQQYGLSVGAASGYVLVGNAGLLVGPPVLGWVSDRLGERTGLLLVASVVFTVGYVALALLGTPPLVVVTAVFFLSMFLLGGFSLAYTVIKERHTAQASGTATGVINSLAYLGAAVFPAVMGWVLDVYWAGDTVAGSRVYTLTGYRAAFGIAAACGAVATLCSLWLHLE